MATPGLHPDGGLVPGDPGYMDRVNQAWQKLRDLPNVKRDYGAKGDGTSDDTSAIQDALNETLGGAGAASQLIIVPKGTYRVGELFPNPGQRLVGIGSGGTHSGDAKGPTVFRAKSGFTGAMLRVQSRGVICEGICFWGHNGAASPPHASGVHVENGQDFKGIMCKSFECVNGLYVDDSANEAAYNNNGLRLWDWTFENCTFGYAIRPGVVTSSSGNCQDQVLYGCHAFQCGVGYLLKQQGPRLVEPYSEGAATYGVQIGESIDSSACIEPVIEWPHIEGSGSAGIRAEKAAKVNLLAPQGGFQSITYAASQDRVMRFGTGDNQEVDFDPGGRYNILQSYIELDEVTTPGNPAANKARLVVRDNGSGKTQLGVIFPTGAFIQIAVEA